MKHLMAKKIASGMAVVFFLLSCLAVTVRAEDKGEVLSFVVFGDNRLPGHLPYDISEKEKIDAFFEQVKEYAFGPDVQMKYDLGFDPDTGDLVWYRAWPEANPAGYILTTLKDGWPELMVRGIPPRVALRAEGQNWVYENVVQTLQEGVKEQGGAKFCLNTGDMTYNGWQGKSLEQSPYWGAFFRRFLEKMPTGAPDGLPARFFPAPGNHETWADEGLAGFRSTFPYLEKMGFTENNRVYMFDQKGCRFIFLDTGDMKYKDAAAWGGTHPDFKEQMETLVHWLEEAQAKKMRHVFITYHCPSFCRSGFGPLPKGHNPHPYIKPFAKDLGITVFNGHVHTTEAYTVDDIVYLVLGQGGGEQQYKTNRMPDDYPPDLYWKGNPRQEEYNYLVVTVSDAKVSYFIHRLRPSSKTEKDVVELFSEYGD